jgi:hypothetical protein
MGTATKYLLYDSSGGVIGAGYTPDGTMPPNSIACTSAQSAAWQGSTAVAGAIVAPPAPPPPTLAQQAAALLPDTDTTMHRIAEAVALGLNAWTGADVVAWVAYRRELRAIAGGAPASALPTKPAYPAGT